ncbi:hypothetical protein V6Z11_D08G225200 [Gossypium hirsutum]
MQRGNGEFFHLYTIHQYTPSFLLAFCNTSYAQKTEKEHAVKTLHDWQIGVKRRLIRAALTEIMRYVIHGCLGSPNKSNHLTPLES